MTERAPALCPRCGDAGEPDAGYETPHCDDCRRRLFESDSLGAGNGIAALIFGLLSVASVVTAMTFAIGPAGKVHALAVLLGAALGGLILLWVWIVRKRRRRRWAMTRGLSAYRTFRRRFVLGFAVFFFGLPLTLYVGLEVSAAPGTAIFVLTTGFMVVSTGHATRGFSGTLISRTNPEVEAAKKRWSRSG